MRAEEYRKFFENTVANVSGRDVRIEAKIEDILGVQSPVQVK